MKMVISLEFDVIDEEAVGDALAEIIDGLRTLPGAVIGAERRDAMHVSVGPEADELLARYRPL